MIIIIWWTQIKMRKKNRNFLVNRMNGARYTTENFKSGGEKTKIPLPVSGLSGTTKTKLEAVFCGFWWKDAPVIMFALICLSVWGAIMSFNIVNSELSQSEAKRPAHVGRGREIGIWLFKGPHLGTATFVKFIIIL